MTKIYVASSWRNKYQQGVVERLREVGHEVYDFMNPEGKTGFSWSEIDPNWKNWTIEEYKKSMNDPIAQAGFNSDFNAMKWADICVLVLPCGRSAHSEAGWMKGAGKKVYVCMPTLQEPELMYKIYDGIFSDLDDLISYVFSHKINALFNARTCRHCGRKYEKSDSDAQRCDLFCSLACEYGY
jgi:hypothetical protein